jgi:alkylation response protein AidB-like acyl-CoA dehydrogenase
LAAEKTARGTGLLLRNDPVVQTEMAVAEARLRAVRAYLHETASTAWDAATQHDFTPAQMAFMRLASTYVSQEARVVVEAAYRAAGSSAIFADQAFERRFRDMHTVSQQIQAHASNYQVAGAHLLGARGGA